MQRCNSRQCHVTKTVTCSNCLASLITQLSSFTCLQRDQLVLFEKVLHTSYSFLLASIVRVMFHKMQHMMTRLMHDHVVVEVPSKDRKALLDTSLMLQHPWYCQKLRKYLWPQAQNAFLCKKQDVNAFVHSPQVKLTRVQSIKERSMHSPCLSWQYLAHAWKVSPHKWLAYLSAAPTVEVLMAEQVALAAFELLLHQQICSRLCCL